MAQSDTVPVWKKLYQIISGGNSNVTTDIIDDILILCKEKLIEGLVEYKPYTRESYDKWKKASKGLAIVSDDEMSSFIHRLSRELDLDVNIAWSVICNYLIFDYYGKVDELKSIIRYEANIQNLIDSIWYYYSADRMFLLKSLRYIYEKVDDTKHEFYEKFKNFLKEINVNVLWKNLIQTFQALINEIDKEKVQMIGTEELVEQWVHRNNCEQSEVLMLMIHTIGYIKLDGNELVQILRLFMRHGFGRHPLYYKTPHISRPKDIFNIKSAEVGVVLAIAQKYWQNPGLCKLPNKDVEKSLELYQIKGDNSIILFIYVILKYTISEDSLDYCNNIVAAVIEKKAFKAFHEILTNDIFSNCKSGEIVFEATNILMTEFMKMCADHRYIFIQEGIPGIASEIMKYPKLKPLESMGRLFETALELFPNIFDHFIDMCSSLLMSEEYYHKILKLLQDMPTFCTDNYWDHHADVVRMRIDYDLFVGSKLFVIPAGSIAEKTPCYGTDVVKFEYHYDFFLVIEQYIKSLTVHTLDHGVLNLVILGYVIGANKFLTHLAKHYRGDFSKDQKLKMLFHRLDCVPFYFSQGSLRHFEFFKMFFKAKCTLVIYNRCDFHEAFTTIVRKMVFPTISEYSLASEEMNVIHTNSDCLLYSFLKEEEMMKDHSLLLLYVELILDIVQKNICHQELQFGGVWYLVNVVFPLHQQWTYEDPIQEKKVFNACVRSFIKLLQKPPDYLSTEDFEIFKLCRDAFMKEELIAASLCTIFVKNKFYLQTLMQQESNWISGPLLENVEAVRLQLVLLLLLFKQRSLLPGNKKCAIDDKTTILAKSASLYLINPYNTKLTILACQFLEVLARDENIPLMASLGLDYDQVQRLFLDCLRDPMEDEDVKLHILDLISTCIHYQNGMTAAFFNVQCSRKWYSDTKKKLPEGDTVADFMIDYLQNIKKSHEYLKSPLQVGILRVMANLWICEKQHLITDVTSLTAFWPLLADPLFKSYSQSPGVYAYLLKIFSIQFSMAIIKPEGQDRFLKTLERFLTDKEQLKLMQKYFIITFLIGDQTDEQLDECSLLIKSLTELLITCEKQTLIKYFPDNETKFILIELCMEGVQLSLANMFMLDVWIDFSLIVFKIFGVSFHGKEQIVASKAIQMCGVIQGHYATLSIRSRNAALTTINKLVTGLKVFFENNPTDLIEFLERIGGIVDYEHTLLEEGVWEKIRNEEPEAKELAIPWMLIVTIANSLLTFKNADVCAVWFTYRKFLPKLMKFICDLLSHRDTLSLAKLALRCLTLYCKSPLALDFLKMNMLTFFDAVEPPLTALLMGRNNKIHPVDLKECWITCTVIMQFNQAFIRRFQRFSLETCYAFMTLNEPILKHIVSIPETTVDLKALDLVIHTLQFFDDILCLWKVEWYRKSNNTYNFMIMGVKSIINACIYICLRPKNINFYYIDQYYRLNQMEKVSSELMALIINRLIGALGLAFTCLYRLNPDLLSMLDVFEPEETIILLILNDFSVPRFELPIPMDLTYGKLLCLADFLCKTLNQVKTAGGGGDQVAVKEEDFGAYVGLVEHQDPSDYRPNQKLSSFLRYAMYEYSGLMDPWIHNLDYQAVKKTSEMLMTFLAQQAFLTVKNLDPTQLPYYKRNLCSELQFFNEHVKKHTSKFSHQVVCLTPVSAITSLKVDMDFIKRYMMSIKENNMIDDMADKNFLLIISYWFSNICQVR